MNKNEKKNGKKLLLIGGMWITAFIVWTALLQMVDVQPCGTNGTDIGFATLNGWFHKWTGVHMTFYSITDWLGLIPVLICCIFGGLGFVQLVKRRSLLKVDYDVLVLGIYYVIVVGSYLIFEMIPLNYRPILIEGRMEVSYPSSTTLLVLCVMPTCIDQMNRRLRNSLLKDILKILVICFSAFMVIARLFSGVHWLTDIVGGVLLSVGLFCFYQGVVLLGNKDVK